MNPPAISPRIRLLSLVLLGALLVLFGYAATFDVRHASVAVVNFDTGQTSRAMLAAIQASRHYTLRMLPDMKSAGAAMDRNEVRVILQIPANLARRREVQLIADGSDPNGAQPIAGELSRLVAQASLAAAAQVLSIRVEERAWFNRTSTIAGISFPGSWPT